MQTINEKEFEELIKREDLTVVDFSASWCMPCRMLKPILERVEKVYDTVVFANVDISDEEELSERYRIFSVPTVVAFKKGKIVDSMVGLKSYDEIIDFVNSAKEK